MILVDTSIWVEMFRRGRFKAELATLIGNDQLCTHPFVVAELACGYLPDRQQTLLELDKLTALPTIRTADVRYMLESRGLFSKGIGFIDAQLIARVHHHAWHANLDHRRASRQSRGVPRPSRNSVTYGSSPHGAMILDHREHVACISNSDCPASAHPQQPHVCAEAHP